MNAITITPAALHAALSDLRIRTHDAETEHAGWRRALDGLGVLCALLDPAHQASTRPVPPVTTMDHERVREMLRGLPTNIAADIGGTFHAPTLAQEEAQPAHADSLAGAGLPEPPAAPAPRVLRHKYPGGRPLSVWTLERDALLTAEFPTCTDTAALLDRINATGDGPHVASKEALGQRAIKLGLRREPDILRAVMRRAASKGLEHANAARLGALARSEEPVPGTSASAAQCAELRRLWATEATVPEIITALAAIDGPPINAKTTIYRMAHALRLPVPRPLATTEPNDAPEAEADAEEDEQPSEPPPEPAPLVLAPRHSFHPLPAVVSPPMTVKEEAFEAFAKGLSVRDIAADFGEPMSTVGMWQAEWRLKNRGSAA